LLVLELFALAELVARAIDRRELGSKALEALPMNESPVVREGRAGTVLAAVSPGELLDKITILEIKSERITDTDKLRHVHAELHELTATRTRAVPGSAELDRLTAELKAVNQTLWDVEDDIRRCEGDKDFGPRFVELARAVYLRNDERAAIKRRINDLLGAAFSEQKAYVDYR
jgi:hypothetical protein